MANEKIEITDQFGTIYETATTYGIRWKNRRRMAWISLISILVVTLLSFYTIPVEKIALLGDVITWFYFTMSAIVCAYMGLTTISSWKGQGGQGVIKK